MEDGLLKELGLVDRRTIGEAMKSVDFLGVTIVYSPTTRKKAQELRDIIIDALTGWCLPEVREIENKGSPPMIVITCSD